jgi:hypothetical protein
MVGASERARWSVLEKADPYARSLDDGLPMTLS